METFKEVTVRYGLKLLVALAGCACASPRANSATLYWDGGTNSISATGDGVSAGGSGTWNAALQNWDAGSGSAHASWNSATPDSAVFGGMPGLVTLGVALTAGSVTASAGGYILDISTNAALTASTLAGSGTLAKTGGGTVTLTGSSPFTGALAVYNGMLQLNTGAALASGAGLTLQGGAGTVGGTAYPFKGLTRGGTLYLRDDSGTPGSAQLGGQPLTLNNGTVLWHSGANSDATRLGTVALAGGFNSLGVGPVGPAPDILKIGNLTRANGAAVEFRAVYHRLGTGEAQIQVTNLNGAAVANTNGILGGWAFVAASTSAAEYGGPARDFAKWDPAAAIGSSSNSIVAATPDMANGTSGGTVNSADLAAATAAENWLINSSSTRNTIAADTTVNSLIEEADVVINNGATLTLASGGLICRVNNFWMQTKSGATGFLTSGGNDLYVQTDGGAASSDQLIKAIIKDGPAGAVTFRKSGPGLLKLNQFNTFTGGTVVNQGTLDLQAGSQIGCLRGAVTVNPGAVLQLSAGDATGWGGGAAALTAINLNGGTLNINTTANQTLGSAVITLAGASITGNAGGNLDFFGGGSALNTLPSSVASTISGTPLSPMRQGNTSFTVADGAAPVDLEIFSVLRNSPSGSDSGTLTKAGTGTLRLSATNTLSRPVAVGAGTLLLGPSGSLAANCAVTVASGATLAGYGTINSNVTAAAGSTLAAGEVGAIGTLTLANPGTNALILSGAVLACDLSSTSVTSDLVAVTGSLVLNGANTVAVSLPSGAAPAGTYTLLTYAAKSGAGTLSLFPALHNATLTVGDTAVTLAVGAGGLSANALTWQGDGSANAWDTATSNWFFGASSTAYAEGEAVTFDDTGSASPAVQITSAAVSPGALTVNNAAKNYMIGGGAINGGGALSKAGTGALSLSSTNGFTGPVTVSGGTLEAAAATTGNASAIGGGANAVTVNEGARLLFSGDRTAGYHTGPVTVNGGRITCNGSDLNLAAGATLTFNNSPGTLDGAGLLRRRGSGNKVAVTATGSGSSISITELNLTDSGPNFDVANGASDSDLTVSSTVSGGGTLNKNGAGTLMLSGINTYSGGSELLAGAVSVGAMSGFGSGYIALKNGAAIQYTGTGSETRAGTYWFDNGNAVLNVASPSATLTLWRTAGAHNKLMIKTGGGTLRYGATGDNGGSSAQVDGGVLEAISSANSAFGSVTVNAGGTFRLGTTDGTGSPLSANHQIADAGAVTVNAGGAFSQNGMSETVSVLSLNGGAVIGQGTLTVATNIFAQSGSVAASLGGAANLIKTTSGTLTLSGANTTTGTNQISAGTLFVNGSHTGAGSYTVASNAVLGGTGTVSLASGAVTLQPGSTLAPGAAPGAGGRLTLSALTLGAAATLAVDARGDLVAVTGDAALSDNPVTVADFGAFDPSARYPLLTYGGSVTGTLKLSGDAGKWVLRHDAPSKTFYLANSRGTVLFLL